MDTTIIAAIIGVIGIIIGAIIGFAGSWIIAKRIINQTNLSTLALNRIQERRKAAFSFHNAFINEIRLLQENIETRNNPYTNIIRPDVMISHEKAKIRFERFIVADQRSAFNEAWEKYKNSKDIYSEQTPLERQNTRDINIDMSELYLKHINDLLEFARF